MILSISYKNLPNPDTSQIFTHFLTHYFRILHLFHPFPTYSGIWHTSNLHQSLFPRALLYSSHCPPKNSLPKGFCGSSFIVCEIAVQTSFPPSAALSDPLVRAPICTSLSHYFNDFTYFKWQTLNTYTSNTDDTFFFQYFLLFLQYYSR